MQARRRSWRLPSISIQRLAPPPLVIVRVIIHAGEEKVVAFTEYINYALQGDAHLDGMLPMGPDDLFTTVADGLVLCKLINR